MRERHGIADARKVSALADECMFVHVTDGERDEVLLRTSEASYAAGMTPEQARFVADLLVSAAERIERRLKPLATIKEPNILRGAK